MTLISHENVKLSDIPIQIFYNEKVEQIRFIEYSQDLPPEPIKYSINEALSGAKTQRRL